LDVFGIISLLFTPLNR